MLGRCLSNRAEDTKKKKEDQSKVTDFSRIDKQQGACAACKGTGHSDAREREARQPFRAVDAGQRRDDQACRVAMVG